MRRVDLYHVYWQWDTYTHLNGGGRGGKGSSEEGGRVNGIHKASSVDKQQWMWNSLGCVRSPRNL